ncbi:hypothetical protein [uncultured Allomuricauda sp.]|uniref:hypothetical protein n=1 Tax=Flagellimonas sp. W118 TaxID=3410791 RepID=UPI002616CE89|nr:hypothetical protein [uncultured Allomuricauda sp.]
MRDKFLFLFVLSLLIACEDTDDFSPSSLIKLMDIKTRNDNAPADGVSRVTVVVSFDKEFSTEDDQKIDFVVFKDSLEMSSQDLVFTSNNDIEQRISELFVVHNRAETIQVKATASANGAQFSRTTNITFDDALPDEINVFADSLVVNPNSFKELTITTELPRTTGTVNSGIIAETIVLDTLGNPHGVFNNYQNKTKEVNSGKIENRFTLGDDNYVGKLFIIATSQSTTGTLKDSLVIFSKIN